MTRTDIINTVNLENDGERMDINYYNMNYDNFDIYQKSHYKRYEAARALMREDFVVGDMACGSGYGSLMLAERCKEVHGVDIDEKTINEIKNRYKDEQKVTFYQKNLLDVDFENKFDAIVSFETVEHFEESEIHKLMGVFHRALKPNGFLLFSTPYNQEKIPASIKWHKTFYITEDKIKNLIQKFFNIKNTYYQNYNSHIIEKELELKHFIICEVEKKS
jgi:2-polyprenyl-3-methyl-5-hydroxy-6-metoxy-1,4-benzoquinol methylase